MKVLIKGAGDLATGVAAELYKRGYQIIMTETAIPLSVRRQVAFSRAVYEPQGAYYVLVDISEYGYADDEQFCIELAKEVGVGAVPGSSFFREDVNHLIRLHFAKQDETLQQALDRLQGMKKLKK